MFTGRTIAPMSKPAYAFDIDIDIDIEITITRSLDEQSRP
jgi:hypothetical protein